MNSEFLKMFHGVFIRSELVIKLVDFYNLSIVQVATKVQSLVKINEIC